MDEDLCMMSYESALRGLGLRAHMVNQHHDAFHRAKDQVERLYLIGHLAVANAEYLEFHEKVALREADERPSHRLLYTRTFSSMFYKASRPLELRLKELRTSGPNRSRTIMPLSWLLPATYNQCTCYPKPNDSPTCPFSVRLIEYDFPDSSDDESDDN
jgi:hypothetical protein